MANLFASILDIGTDLLPVPPILKTVAKTVIGGSIANSVIGEVLGVDNNTPIETVRAELEGMSPSERKALADRIYQLTQERIKAECGVEMEALKSSNTWISSKNVFVAAARPSLLYSISYGMVVISTAAGYAVIKSDAPLEAFATVVAALAPIFIGLCLPALGVIKGRTDEKITDAGGTPKSMLAGLFGK